MPAPSIPPPTTRQIDPRGHRFGAALSVVVLVLGFAIQVPLVVPAVALALGVSALFGTRYSILGRPWLVLRKLAATGYCLGCRLYGLRWYAPRLFNRLVAMSSRDAIA